MFHVWNGLCTDVHCRKDNCFFFNVYYVCLMDYALMYTVEKATETLFLNV